MGEIKGTYVKLRCNKDPLSTSLSCSVLMKSIEPEREKNQLSDVHVECQLTSIENMIRKSSYFFCVFVIL